MYLKQLSTLKVIFMHINGVKIKHYAVIMLRLCVCVCVCVCVCSTVLSEKYGYMLSQRNSLELLLPLNGVRFSSVQSLSPVGLFATP